jgi:hypothetical protein
MQSVEQNRSWAEENQAYLVAEFASLSARLRPSEDTSSESVAELERAASELRFGMQSSPSIDVLSSLFSLTEFERHLLLLCAGVEMDSRLSERCSRAHGNGSRAHVTFGLAMAVLPEPHWSALTVMRPLRRFGMIDVLPGGTLTSGPLHIDERILHYLAGINALDPRLQPVLRSSAFPEWIADSHRSLALRVAEFVDGHAQHSPLVQLCGDDPPGHEDIAALAAHCVGKQLFTLRADELPALGMDLDRVGSLWQRESVLLSGLLLVQCPASELTPPARHLLETLPGPLFLSSR